VRALHQRSTSSIVRAAVYTFVGLAIPTAVVGLFAAPAIFGVASPYIFVIALGAKAAYHFGSAGINFSKCFDDAYSASEKMVALKNGVKDTVTGLIGTLATAGAAGVFVLLKPVLFPLGLAAGVLGAVVSLGFLGSKYYEARKNGKSFSEVLRESRDRLLEEGRDPRPDSQPSPSSSPKDEKQPLVSSANAQKPAAVSANPKPTQPIAIVGARPHAPYLRVDGSTLRDASLTKPGTTYADSGSQKPAFPFSVEKAASPISTTSSAGLRKSSDKIEGVASSPYGKSPSTSPTALLANTRKPANTSEIEVTSPTQRLSSSL